MSELLEAFFSAQVCALLNISKSFALNVIYMINHVIEVFLAPIKSLLKVKIKIKSVINTNNSMPKGLV